MVYNSLILAAGFRNAKAKLAYVPMPRTDPADGSDSGLPSFSGTRFSAKNASIPMSRVYSMYFELG